jgi:hypothetical protein
VIRIAKSDAKYEQKIADLIAMYRIKRDSAIRWLRIARAMQ